MHEADEEHRLRPDSGRRDGWDGPSKPVAEERERCAKIAEDFVRKCGSVGGREAAAEIAARIRAPITRAEQTWDAK